jgi:hypothetical protein
MASQVMPSVRPTRGEMTETVGADMDRRASLVVEQFDGIYAPYEAFYIRSIMYSSGRARDAFVRFEVARAVRNGADNQVSAVHEALGHAASLSRFFWPSGAGGSASPALKRLKQARGAKLRTAFEVRHDSPLRSRRLRDGLEHFDERLDSFVLTVDAGYFFPDPLVGDSELADEPAGHIFKLLDPERSSFVLLGQKYEFGVLRQEVERIHERARGMDENGGRLGTPSSSHDGA